MLSAPIIANKSLLIRLMSYLPELNPRTAISIDRISEITLRTSLLLLIATGVSNTEVLLRFGW
ncbi:hypothetical protein PHMEG_00029457 [Phytophthora megakarya]|uniref:Uncharacterized protein n=1 Tax=Phytophthora megakarya TaxID=4795 RepID=A0A225V3K6_9STRA|nr:hypothetical protein PHMEG_00029457 [Phytophthora megakarya]